MAHWGGAAGPDADAEESTHRVLGERLLPGLVLLLCLLAYWPALSGGWVWDDHFQIAGSGALDHPLGLWAHDVWWLADAAPGSNLYRPLAVSTYVPGRWLGGGPGFEHALSLALHLACVVLVALLARAAGAGVVPAWLGAALLGVHPGASESVAWISARHDLLGCLLLLAGWLALLRRRQVLCGVLLGLAPFAKEPFLLAPLSVVVWMLGTGRRGGTALLIACGGGVLYVTVRTLLGNPLPLGAADAGDPFGAAGGVALRGLALALLPGSADALPLLQRSVVTTVVAMLAALLLLLRLRDRPALAALLAPLPILLPAVPASDATGIVGDRYLYVAFAGLAVSVALGLSAVWQRRRGLVLLWAVVPALALGTWSRALEWQDDASVFRASLERDPHNPHAAFHLAHALHAHAGDCAAAAPLYRRALEADPRAGNNLQACLLDLGRIEEAARMGPRLAARDPENATPAANTARAHLRLRQLDPAEHWAREALRRNPDRARSWTLLGEVLGSRGELLAARDAFREAIARDPDDVGATRGREAAEALLARRGG